MKSKFPLVFLLSFLFFPVVSYGRIYPQAGIITYLGPNHLYSYTPWAGLRFGLVPHVSFIVKYYNHNIRFDYPGVGVETVERVARLSNFTAVLYAQKWHHDFYSALSYFTGTDSYTALAFHGGTNLKISDRFRFELGTYLINESSVLWYPGEEERKIFLYSFNSALSFGLKSWLHLKPRIYLYRNSEQVNAFTYALEVVFIPKHPFYINLVYYRYKESARYRFSGHYVGLSLNFYY